MTIEDTGTVQGSREVERSLATETRQQALGLLLRDDGLDDLDGEWLEVDRVSDRWVGHDRRVGFELMRIVRTPSARSARQACVRRSRTRRPVR